MYNHNNSYYDANSHTMITLLLRMAVVSVLTVSTVSRSICVVALPCLSFVVLCRFAVLAVLTALMVVSL